MRPSAGVRRGRRGLSTDACAALGEAGREEDEERRAEGGGPSGLLAERAGGRRAGYLTWVRRQRGRWICIDAAWRCEGA